MGTKEQAQAFMGGLLLKAMIAEADEETRNQVNAAVDKIQAVLTEHGDNGRVALSLVMFEVTAGDFKP